MGKSIKVSPIRKRINLKIYSDYKELEGKVFTTVRECQLAEAKIDADKAAVVEQNKKAELSKRKKEAADAITKADEALNKAYANYESAKEKVRNILEESNKQMEAILTPAKEAVNAAEKLRASAIQKYTSEFGVYQSVYTGERAQQELDRFNKQFNNAFSNIVKAFIF